MFFDARSAARQQLATTNQLMNSLVERASLSLCLFSSTFLFCLAISPLLLMAQPLCPAIHSGPVNSGAKRHPAVVVNAAKRYKAASRVSTSKQQQMPTVSSAAHRFYFTLSAPLQASFLNVSYFNFRVNCPVIVMENGVPNYLFIRVTLKVKWRLLSIDSGIEH